MTAVLDTDAARESARVTARGRSCSMTASLDVAAAPPDAHVTSGVAVVLGVRPAGRLVPSDNRAPRESVASKGTRR